MKEKSMCELVNEAAEKVIKRIGVDKIKIKLKEVENDIKIIKKIIKRL